MSLLERLQAAGELDSRGTFTVDEVKAREKMGRFQLTDCSRFLLELVAAAHLLKARAFRLTTSSQEVRLELEGLQFPSGLPQRLSQHILDGRSPWQRMAVAFNALSSQSGVHLELQVEEGQTYLWGSSADDWDTATHLRCIRIRGLQPELLEQATRLLTQQTAWSDLPILLNGKPQTRPSHPCGTESARYRRDGYDIEMGWALEGAAPGLRIVVAGLCYTVPDPPLALPLRVLIWTGGSFNLDASYSSIVADSGLEHAQRVVAQLSHQLLEDSLQAGPLRQRLLERSEFRRLVLEKVHHPLRDQVPLFQASDGHWLSLQQLDTWQRPLRVCRERDLLIPGDLLCLLCAQDFEWEALQKLFPHSLQDILPQLRQRQAAERNRLAWEKRSREQARLSQTVLLKESIEGPGFQGEIGIATSSGSSHLTTLLRGRSLGDVQVDSQFPFVAILDFEELDMRPDWSGHSAGPRYQEALRLLRERARAMAVRLSSSDSPLTPALRRYLIEILSSKDKSRHSLFRNTALFPTALGELVSLQFIVQAGNDGRSIGFLDPSIDLSGIPPECLPCDLLLVLNPSEQKLVSGLLARKLRFVDQSQTVLREAQRFREPRDPLLGQIGEETARVEDDQGAFLGELALLPKVGSISVEVLHHGVSLGIREIGWPGCAARAILELPDIVPEGRWSSFSGHDPAWLRAQERVRALALKLFNERCRRPQLPPAWMRTLSELVWRSPLDEFSGLREVPVIEAVPQRISLATLAGLAAIDYAPSAAPASLHSLGLPLVVVESGPNLQRLRRLLASHEWRDVSLLIEKQTRLLSFQARPLLDYAQLASPYRSLPLAPPWRGALVWTAQNSNALHLCFQDREVEVVDDALPVGFQAWVEHPQLALNDRSNAILRGDDWADCLEDLHHRCCRFVLESTPWMPLDLSFAWLKSERSSRLGQLGEFDQCPVWESFSGAISPAHYRRQGKPEQAYLYLRRDQASAWRTQLPAEQLPSLLLLHPHELESLGQLKSWLRSPVEDANSYLTAQQRRWKLNCEFQELERRFPRCWIERALPDGRIGIPQDDQRELLINVAGRVQRRSFPYPIVGYLHSERAATEEIGQLYLDLAQSGPVGARSALITFLAEHLAQLQRPAPDASWAQRLREMQFWPAESKARVSLQQLQEWSQGLKTNQPMAYLQAPGKPLEPRPYPLPILADEAEFAFLRAFLKRRLEATEALSWRHSTLAQMPARVKGWFGDAYTKLESSVLKFFDRPEGEAASEVESSKLERRAQRQGERHNQSKQRPHPTPAAPATPKPAVRESDPEREVLRHLRREAELLLPSSARRALLRELELVRFGRYLFGPVFWYDSGGFIKINRNHKQVQRILLNYTREPAYVIHLLIMLISYINFVRSDIHDSEELQFLDKLEDKLLASYPEGLDRPSQP